ncbi:MAG: hypothetical protein KF749_13640 [Bacteroidetes bacterium]|nr:hypothetical protein [Bacteroidota bacterium]MCW5896303.1 hypothetical protein [Bacteroidota bacterium]
MKLAYSLEDIERWREKTYRRAPKSQIMNQRQALAFIKRVGFCLATKTEGLELPNLWDAITDTPELRHNGRNSHSKRNYYLSYAWEIQSILPNHNSIFYGKIFKRRPSMVSRQYLPYFYALSGRSGERDEYKTEHASGKLSILAKRIMDILMKKKSPLTSKELRVMLTGMRGTSAEGLDRALDELQRKMFISRIVGNSSQFGAEWSPIVKSFPAEVRKSRRISAEEARSVLVEKYFQNQLISSVEAIHAVFGWPRQLIYHAIGQLVHKGMITPVHSFDGKKGKFYCFVP